ncbi:MAG: hypothetical protein ACPGWM_02955, partial [Flavobacteriales bacterium]
MTQKKSNLIDADDLRPIAKFIGKNWWIMISLPIIAYAIAAFFNHKQADIYAAKTEILLKSSETYDYQNQIYSNLGYYSILADITNQQRILQSYDIIKSTLDRLEFDVNYYLVGRFTDNPKQQSGFSAFTVEIDLKNKRGSKMYNVPINIKILSTSEYELSYNIAGDQIVRRFQFNEANTGELDYDITLKTKDLNAKTLEQFSSLTYQIRVQNPERLIKKFQRSLGIQKVEYTSILTLQSTHELQERAKQFLDTLSAVYIETTLSSQISVNENTEKYIDKQLRELETIMDSLETHLESFKEQKNILDLDREKNEFFEDLIEYESDLRKLELRVESMKNLEEFLDRGVENGN